MQSARGTSSIPERTNGLGTITYNPFLTLPTPPNIVAEWTSLIPLVVYLASYWHNHQLAGEAALSGRLYVNLFPRLGVLHGIARLLAKGPEFLDRVSTMGEVSHQVWDVNWGSAFPCANGAASSIITAYALSRADWSCVRMPDHVSIFPHHQNLEKVEKIVDAIPETSPGCKADRPGVAAENIQPAQNTSVGACLGELSALLTTLALNQADTCQEARSAVRKPGVGLGFRRYQTLHVIDFGRQKLATSYGGNRLIDQIADNYAFQATRYLILLGVVVILCLGGIFGTAVILLMGVVTQVSSQFLTVQRPSKFLENNEAHSACMLLSSHKNSATWYLYIGDRGVVDSLLNKPMFSIPPVGKFFTHWFSIAHVVQLLAMTFVAAEKGWDGLALVILLLLANAMHWRHSKSQLAQRWLRTEDVCVKAKSFEFTGRTAMLGAIHKMSGTTATDWMDEIMPRVPRRQIWLNRLRNDDLGFNSTADSDIEALSRFDQDWVLLNTELATKATGVLQTELDQKSWA